MKSTCGGMLPGFCEEHISSAICNFFAVYSFLSKLSLVCVCLVSEEVPASVGDKKFICGKAGPMIPIRRDETASLVGMISSIAGLKTSS